MKTYFWVLSLLSFYIPNIYSQEYFEGEIQYKINYESLDPNVSSNYYNKEYGDSITCYIKEDRIISIYNGGGKLGWCKIIVRLDEKYTYTEFEKIDTIIKSGFGTLNQKLIEIKKRPKDRKEILGELCKSINLKFESINYDSTLETYYNKCYYSPKYKLNPDLYIDYTDYFSNLYAKEAKAISLGLEGGVHPHFKFIQEAIYIKEKEIPLKMFEPNSSKVILLEK